MGSDILGGDCSKSALRERMYVDPICRGITVISNRFQERADVQVFATPCV
jgi:hypothetical protein